jgi:hypothetical protein
MAQHAEGLRTRLYDNPEGKFVHDVILASCRQHAAKTAIVDTSCTPARRITYAAYGELVERAARGLVAAGVRPGEMIGIYLPNCWEFGVAYHAATLAGAVPTTMNPTYREREVRYQLETADAVALISDGALLTGIDLSGLPALRNVYTIRNPGPSGSQMWESLFAPNLSVRLPKPERNSRKALAILPFSSGTTGLPKGVMLSHFNLVANVFQTLTPGEFGALSDPDVLLCFLPLYHIYRFDRGLESHAHAGLHPGIDAAFRLRTFAGNHRAGERDDHPVRASNAAGVLPGSGTGEISAPASPALGEVRSGPACPGTGAPFYSGHWHSDPPRLRNDGSLASYACGISSPRAVQTGFRRRTRGTNRMPDCG